MSNGVAVADLIEVTVAAWSDPGRARTENQDHYLVADLGSDPGGGGPLLHPEGEPADMAGARLQLGPRGLLAMVADGMGGAAGGRIASHFAVAWTYRELLARLDPGQPTQPAALVAALCAAIEAANLRVHGQGQRTPEYAGMGSTVTAVAVLHGAYYVAQIGDSRAYLVRSGVAHRLTRDQSLVQTLVDAGAMSAEEALRSPQGSVLLQALGTSDSVKVEVTWQQARRGDVLVVCSDGLFRVLPDADIAATVASTPQLGALCRALVQAANERGGPDNITVVAARLDGDALPPPSPDEVLALQPYTPVAP